MPNLPFDLDYDDREVSRLDELLALQELRRNMEWLAPAGLERYGGSMALTRQRTRRSDSMVC